MSRSTVGGLDAPHWATLHQGTEAHMRALGVVVGLAWATGSLQAQASAEQLARCAAIPGPTLRLLCYDALAKPRSDSAIGSPRELPASTRMIENWAVSVETDPITDQKGVTFMLRAEGANQINTPTLII